jgi:hypothetical protein
VANEKFLDQLADGRIILDDKRVIAAIRIVWRGRRHCQQCSKASRGADRVLQPGNGPRLALTFPGGRRH